MRIARACRELGIKTVAVCSEADIGALHTRVADEVVCIGPPAAAKSYLNVPSLISAAEITGAEAIHPGYGFLSENPRFAEVVTECGLTFIGPSADAMRAWGDKVTARRNAARFGFPMLSGTTVLRDADHAVEEARRVGFPVILKASGGGGGRGMRVVRSADEVPRAFESATSEAISGFKNPDIYLERFVEEPRHIEFQVVADAHGGVWIMGERECSLQRRHQKIIEEAPSLQLALRTRDDLSEMLAKAVRETGYTTLGTFEFLMDERGNLFFMEMNTRVQVEHPVTEEVWGVDLVEQQLRAAAGERLSLRDTRGVAPGRHAIECRINAEDPDTFAPWPGRIEHYHAPGGRGIRVDSGVFAGWRVPAHYDSMLAKLIAFGGSREEARKRMLCALHELAVEGIRTNRPLHQALLSDKEVIDGLISTRTIERLIARSREEVQLTGFQEGCN